LSEKIQQSQPEEVQSLGGLDPDVAEAAALAHDLGHPPFGHLAEAALNRLCEDIGGYEGNAQSFRIVTVLAVGDGLGSSSGDSVVGLNLTRATLNGILKYPWIHRQNPAKTNKWGAYESERSQFTWVREALSFPENVKGVEAEIMDWADDITFSVHDLIDFYCAGQIPLDVLAADSDGGAERSDFFEEVFQRCEDIAPRRHIFEEAFTGIMEYCPLNRRYVGSRDQRCKLSQFATMLISRYVDGIRLDSSRLSTGSCIEIQDGLRDEIRMLKELTWHYVILENDLATEQHGKRRMVETVFGELYSAAQNRSSWNLFPPFFAEHLQNGIGDKKNATRVVADYIASMTEQELMRTFRLLTGSTPKKPGKD
jgi:dGTPase